MRGLWTVIAVFALPALAWGEDGTTFSMVGAMLQMVASLALVVGGIFLVSRLSSRYLKNMEAGRQRHIRLVETRYLAPKKSLVLVEIGGEYLLLGSSGDSLQLIKEVRGIEEKPAEKELRPLGEAFQERLQAFSKKMAEKRNVKAPLAVLVERGFEKLLRRLDRRT